MKQGKYPIKQPLDCTIFCQKEFLRQASGGNRSVYFPDINKRMRITNGLKCMYVALII